MGTLPSQPSTALPSLLTNEVARMDAEHLSHLHDATVHSIRYGTDDAAGRDLRVSLTCSSESAFPSWTGRDLTFVARDVLALRHLMWSTANVEQLNFVSTGISEEARLQLRLDKKRSRHAAGEELTIVFHSGSSIELICREYGVTEDEQIGRVSNAAPVTHCDGVT